MAAEKALAIVVRGTDWSETSRITTLFTREFGKVRALAKGGRRLKSNFDSAFDLHLDDLGQRIMVDRLVLVHRSDERREHLAEPFHVAHHAVHPPSTTTLDPVM